MSSRTPEQQARQKIDRMLTAKERYVFWRTPTGTPDKKNGGKHAPILSLGRIGQVLDLHNGNLRWADATARRFMAAIRTAVVVLGPDKRELNSTDAWTIVYSAIKAVLTKHGGKKAIDPILLIDEADKQGDIVKSCGSTVIMRRWPGMFQ